MLRGRSGLAVPGFVPVAGVVVLLAVVPLGVVPGVVVVPLPLVAPELAAGVAAGVDDGGNDVSGVGSGGNGLERMPAMSSGIPVSLSLFLNLYQVLRLSFHCVFCVA